MSADGYNVYIAYYDLGDRDICAKLKQRFAAYDKVCFIDQDISCIEWDSLFDKFDFLISSRFHSIVHAYKHYVPCLVVGWAEKYLELTRSLQQMQFVVDCRTQIDQNDFFAKLQKLISSRDEQSLIIKQSVNKIQKNSCFDKMWKCLRDE